MTATENRYRVDKEQSTPLYEQLKRNILCMIEDHTLSPGDMIPTEAQLCEQLRISRPTIRQALGDLVAQGYLCRVKGRGTFVARPDCGPRLDKSALCLTDPETFPDSCRPRVRVLDFRRVPASCIPPEERDRVSLSRGGPLFLLRRLQFVGEEPAALFETYMPGECCVNLRAADLTQPSLRKALETLCGVCVHRISYEIEAVCATPREAQTLHIKPFAPLLLVRMVGGSDDGNPFEITNARYRGDRVRFCFGPCDST